MTLAIMTLARVAFTLLVLALVGLPLMVLALAALTAAAFTGVAFTVLAFKVVAGTPRRGLALAGAPLALAVIAPPAAVVRVGAALGMRRAIVAAGRAVIAMIPASGVRTPWRARPMARLAGTEIAFTHAGFSHARRALAIFACAPTWIAVDTRVRPPHKPARGNPRPNGDFVVFSVRFGGVSRVAKGADCKSAGYAFVGSSPTSPTSLRALTGASARQASASAKAAAP
jgi:hypothetical protein